MKKVLLTLCVLSSVAFAKDCYCGKNVEELVKLSDEELKIATVLYLNSNIDYKDSLLKTGLILEHILNNHKLSEEDRNKITKYSQDVRELLKSKK